MLKCLLALPFQPDRDEYADRQARPFLIDQRDIAADQPRVLHDTDAPQNRRGRQADTIRELLHGQPAILLQQIKDLAVDSIQF